MTAEEAYLAHALLNTPIKQLRAQWVEIATLDDENTRRAWMLGGRLYHLDAIKVLELLIEAGKKYISEEREHGQVA